MKCLGIDIGSTTIKGAVLDLERRRIGSIVRESFPDPIAGLGERRFEVDPNRIASSTQRVIEKLMGLSPDATAIFSCGQMGGVLLLDPATYTPLTNYISWRDQRSLEKYSRGGTYLEEVRRRWAGATLAELGNELKPGSATSLLFWLAENKQLPASAIAVGIGDYVLAKLCNAPPRMDATQTIGLRNLKTAGWHYAAFEQLGIGRTQWPKLAETHETIGNVQIAHRALACYPVLGDQQCALFGAGLGEGDLSLNISTGGQVSRITRELELGNYQTRSYLLGRYLNTITHLPAGRSLNALHQLLTELAKAEGQELADSWNYIANAAMQATGGGLACDLAFFSGPLGDEGSISHISVDNLTVGNLFHAAFQNIADNFSRCSQTLSSAGEWRQVVLSGGLTRTFPLLRQLLEKKFTAPIRESLESEETLAGLLHVAQDVLYHDETA